MSYRRPEGVDSPQSHWLLHRVLYDGGEFDWSAAEGQWKHYKSWEPRLAIRWNGGGDAEIGNPQSRGNPTWFIVPPDLEDAIRTGINRMCDNSKKAEPARG